MPFLMKFLRGARSMFSREYLEFYVGRDRFFRVFNALTTAHVSSYYREDEGLRDWYGDAVHFMMELIKQFEEKKYD